MARLSPPRRCDIGTRGTSILIHDEDRSKKIVEGGPRATS